MFLNNGDDNFTSHFYRITIVENISFTDIYKNYNLFCSPTNVLDIILTFIHLFLKENNLFPSYEKKVSDDYVFFLIYV